MKRLSLIIFIALALILSGCGAKDDESADAGTGDMKKDFIIKTQNLGELGNVSYIDKTGKLTGKDDITISSQAMGQVSEILYKEGDNITANQIVVKMNDKYSRYGIASNKASTALQSMKIEYENTKIRLDKAVQDAEINLERVQQDYETTLKNVEEDKKNAQINLNTADLSEEQSVAKLNYEKLVDELDKSKLDYNNTLEANQETIDGFKRQIGVEYNNIRIQYTDIIDFADKLLGVTDLNKSSNDYFEDYLGAKNSILKTQVKSKVKELIKSKENFEKNNFERISEDELENHINKLSEGYEEINVFLKDLENVILASVVSKQLPQTAIDGYSATTNGYQSSIQGLSNGITSFKNQVTSFLKSYKNNEKSLEENIVLLAQNVIIAQKQLETANETAKIGYNKTEIAIESQLKNAEIALTNAKNTLQNAIETRDVTLRSIQNSIKNAEIGVFETSQEISKLTVKTPINGQISAILVDIGEEVSVGTPLFSIVNNNKQEVIVGFSAEQVPYINVGDELTVMYGPQTFTGTISSISQIADANLNYNAEIIIDEDIKLLGSFVDIKVPVVNNNILVPVNIVKIGQNNTGTINILEDNKPKSINVTVGKIWNDKIEILSGLEQDMEVITSDIKNYDEKKHNIIVE